MTIPAAFLFGVRLLEATTGAVVDVHADLPAPSGLPWFLDAVWLPLRRLSGSMLAGYASGRVHDHWEVWPTVGFTVLAIGLSLRTEARRPARVLLVALGVFAVASLTFRATTGRSLPHEPRVFLTLLPFLATTWIAALHSLRPSLRPVALSLLAVSISTETGVQLWSRSTMHRDAALLVANSGARLHADAIRSQLHEREL